NPLPAFRPGETMASGSRRGRAPGFNPLPAFRPGETRVVEMIIHAPIVSIRSRLFGREKLRLGNHWPPKRICRVLREPSTAALFAAWLKCVRHKKSLYFQLETGRANRLGNLRSLRVRAHSSNHQRPFEVYRPEHAVLLHPQVSRF